MSTDDQPHSPTATHAAHRPSIAGTAPGVGPQRPRRRTARLLQAATLAEGTALIEVIQRGAELVGHDLPDEYRSLSSTDRREA